ncbi:multiheme c-type cytochrome [Paracoccus ravus]|uniref:multiheme c-type cytochrome n=1 Tax=Paracoccus ravus TaxID=2447760 RepID=UPI001FD6C5FA|nr:multiheme c-type cytochrome [Paracoccus ravus]
MLKLAAMLFLASASMSIAQDHPVYVGSQTCASCHADEAQSWKNSDHGLAWTEPVPENVLADFDGTSFSGSGTSVQFSRRGEKFHASVTEMDGKTTEYDVHSVVGVKPLQQYLFETEPGRLQSFDVVWDVDRKEWFHLYPDDMLAPTDGLHWSGPYKNWNARCAECHATGYRKRYDPATRTYASMQAEIGVGCEACHGPGSAHLHWAEDKKPIERPGLDAYGFTMSVKAGTEGWIQQCANCHSRREAFGDGNPLPGTPYHDSYRLALLTPQNYHADGQIKEEVYVYGSFLQSKMYAKGVGCTNCHDPHEAKLKAEGNAICTQCHSEAGNPDFPSLPLKVFDGPEHHFHMEGSAGAECRNCHMTEQTYMGNDERADHSFRIPRPDLAKATGAPDACTSCHKDRTADWAAETIAAWYPDSTHRGTHFGTSFAKAATDPAAALPELLRIARDTAQPDLVRATALYLMEPAADEQAVTDTAPLLADDSAMIRTATARLYRAASPLQKVQDLLGLLDDPARLVRISTAQELLAVPMAHMPKAIAQSMQRVTREWRDSLANRTDFPETHLVLAGTALTMRNFSAAEGAFREAVRLDPQLVDAWVMIVRIKDATEGPEAARTALDEALEANPGEVALLDLALRLGG